MIVSELSAQPIFVVINLPVMFPTILHVQATHRDLPRFCFLLHPIDISEVSIKKSFAFLVISLSLQGSVSFGIEVNPLKIDFSKLLLNPPFISVTQTRAHFSKSRNTSMYIGAVRLPGAERVFTFAF